MPRILVGTSGFAFRDWKGTVYPPSIREAECLPWYAQHLDMVELNFSFYRMPHAQMLERMLHRVPEHFRFVIKGHRSLTHDIDSHWRRQVTALRDAARPLLEREKLVATLFQFPYRFHYTHENREYLAKLCDASTELHPAVEFRNVEWFRERTRRGLSERTVTLVIPDLPDLPNLPNFTPMSTTDTAYVRLHGRNRNTWWTGNNDTRYFYRYTEEELKEIAGALQPFSNTIQTLTITFNNHFQGNAFHNAQEMSGLLTEVVDGA